MEHRWLNSVVVLFWAATMSWLVVAKVVPPLRRGEPPNYRSMYTDSPADMPPVAWEMTLKGKPLGNAVSRLEHKDSTGMTEVAGRIHFDRVPVEELSPAWIRPFMPPIDTLDKLEMDISNVLVIDPLGHLSEFRSVLKIPGVAKAIRITGRVQATRLFITVESIGDAQSLFETSTWLPANALVSDELSPQPRLVGLRVGQQWTVPVFSPLRPSNDPIEILDARVEEECPFVWNGNPVKTHLVVYRSDSGSALSSSREPRAKLWVGGDGTVLKQEATVLGSQLVFNRLPEERAWELYRQWESLDGVRRGGRGWYNGGMNLRGWPRSSYRRGGPMGQPPSNGSAPASAAESFSPIPETRSTN